MMKLIDLIFPQKIYCISCGSLIDSNNSEYSICDDCFKNIRWSSIRSCKKCGKELSEDNGKSICRDCSSATHNYGKGYSCALYDEKVADIIRGLKYRNNSHYAHAMSIIMAERYKAEVNLETGEIPYHDFVVNVPMTKKKKRIRGFDQAELLAREFSRRIGVNHEANMIERKKETLVMSNLGVEDRNQNMIDAFEIKYDMIMKAKGSKILIIDDVYTTGSTVNGCAQALLNVGASEVDFFVFASGSDIRRDEGFL